MHIRFWNKIFKIFLFKFQDMYSAFRFSVARSTAAGDGNRW